MYNNIMLHTYDRSMIVYTYMYCVRTYDTNLYIYTCIYMYIHVYMHVRANQ